MRVDKMDRKRVLQAAFESFMQKDFQKAYTLFEKMLHLDPQDKSAKLGIILCDLAKEDEEEASALFDFYIILKEEKESEPEERVMEMVEALDSSQESLQELIEEREPLFLQEGISYKDFKRIVESRGGFKRAFEDIMYSTKVVITQKSDFFDFLENLIEHGFTDMVYSYLEDASQLYPTDKKLQEFVEKLDSEKR